MPDADFNVSQTGATYVVRFKVAAEAIPAPSLLQRVGIAIVRAWRRIAGGQTVAAPTGALLVGAAEVSY